MTSKTCWLLLLVLPALIPIGLAAAPDEPGTAPAAAVDDTAAALGRELIEAAQADDTERALELLERGADVASATRYGATALFFAADKGNLTLVRALIERGADVDVTDTFYRSTPIRWALFSIEESEPHRAIVLALLGAGAKDAGAVLASAARAGDAELARAAVDSGAASGADLRNAARAAREAGHEELAGYLEEKAPAEEPAAKLELPMAVLESFVGGYKNDEFDLVWEVFIEGGELKLRRPRQETLTLEATGDRTFAARDAAGLGVVFRGRAGLIEGFAFEGGGGTHVFNRVESGGERTAAEPPAAAPLPRVERRPAAPWPGFRGPALSGIGDGQGAPTEWSGPEGRNVLWKTPIPGIGLSSPIVWGERIFVTTAVSSAGDSTFRTGLYGDVDSVADDSEHTWKVYALDRGSGEVLWERTAAVGVPKRRRHLKSSHANPTPVTDGERVVVHFGSEGLFCYSVDGELLWHRQLGVLSSGWFYDPSYEWGFSSSPILHDGLVIVQTDVQKSSFIAAFDLATGEERWRTPRDEIPSWGTPNLLENPNGSAEIVTNARTIRGYDAQTGAELWTLGPNSELTVGSPVVGGGLAYVTGGYPPVRPIYAIRPGGRGDLSLPEGETASARIAWSAERGGTYIPTPILYRGQLYMLHNDGRLTAHDAATGAPIYRARVGGAESFSGSPVAADGRLYFTSEEGQTYVVRSGPVFEVLAENELGEVVMTTPAISGGTLIVRGMNHVYALGEAATGK